MAGDLPKQEQSKQEKQAEQPIATPCSDKDFAKWASKFDGDLSTLDVRKVTAECGFALTHDDSERVRFRCLREAAHANPSSDRDCEIRLANGSDRKYPSGGRLHKSCGLTNITALLDWLEKQHPGCIDRCCRKRFDGLPEECDLFDLMKIEVPEPPHIIKDLHRVGQIASLTGAAKTNKSWTAMEIALGISQGGRFMDWDAICAPLFYVDSELEQFDFRKRMEAILSSAKYSLDPDEFK